MVLFTCNVKNIKGAAHKNGDTDSRSKRATQLDVFAYLKVCDSRPNLCCVSEVVGYRRCRCVLLTVFVTLLGSYYGCFYCLKYVTLQSGEYQKQTVAMQARSHSNGRHSESGTTCVMSLSVEFSRILS